jgi:hypothetical protein
MFDEFDIIEYLSGLTAFVFDKAVLKRIAYERGVTEVEDYEDLDEKTRELLKADLLYTAYYSPNTWASSQQTHGSYSKSIGSQTLSADSKERLYNTFVNIYTKYNDDKLSEVKSSDGNLQWIEF